MYYLCIDLDTSAAATSSDSDPPMEEELNLEPPEPPVDEPPIAEDDEGEEEEPVEEPTAEEIVQVGVARGQLDNDVTIPVDQREIDEAEE